MNSRSGNSLTHSLLVASALIMAASLFGGGLLIMDRGGGFFPGLGSALGVLLMGAGNLVSWLLNLGCWYRTRWRWLGMVVALQALPAILFASWLGLMWLDGFLENRASEQRAHLYRVIERDDVAGLPQALERCGARCRTFYSPQRVLMLASSQGAHQIARYLIKNNIVATLDSASESYNARTSLRTCEGDYLPSLGALDLTVAHQDIEMLALLWPISAEPTRQTALWTAARLDRLAMVKLMSGAQTSPDVISPGTTQPLVRPVPGGEQETLLEAAASGAATGVGRWLLEERPLALSQPDIQRALTNLLQFALDIDTPRSASFAHLLKAHGADIRLATLQDEPALERAVAYRSKELATLLLDLGADPAILSEPEVAHLEALLQEPDRHSTYGKNTPGCVAP